MFCFRGLLKLFIVFSWSSKNSQHKIYKIMDQSPQINSVVKLPGEGEAILKYVGEVQGKEGIFAGVELLGSLSSKGKNSGTVNGTKYFSTSVPNSGLFLPYRKLILSNSNNGSHKHNNNNNGNMGIHTSTPTRISKNVSLNESPMLISSNVELASNVTTPSGLIDSNGNYKIDKMKNELTLLHNKNNELEKKVKVYETRLEKRELDFRDLDIQLDELDSMLKQNEQRLLVKDQRHEKYKKEKDEEIQQLIEAIEVLEQHSKENETLFSEKLNSLEEQLASLKSDDKQNEAFEKYKIEKENEIIYLKSEIELITNNFNDFKISKNKEINRYRDLEMENYKISVELEELKTKGSESGEVEQLKQLNIELNRNLNELLNEIKNKDSEINNLREGNRLLSVEKKLTSKIEPDIPKSSRDLEDLLTKLQEKENLVTVKDKRILELQNQLETSKIKPKELINDSGELKIYKPEIKVDPSAGREKFCSFCDRNGHGTSECPYENDSMEMF